MIGDFAREKELEMLHFFRNNMITVVLIGFAIFVTKDKGIIN